MEKIMKEFWIIKSEKNDTVNKDSLSICTFVGNMQQQANLARHYVENFKDHYKLSEETSLTLEFFPKRTPDEVDGIPSAFEGLELDEFVKNAYQDLQKFALGMYTIYEYQVKNGTEVKDETKRQMWYLNSLLYEIAEYLNAYDITPFPDVRSENLPIQYKTDSMDYTKYRIFSHLVVQEYVNTLNYVHAGLSHFNQTECK